MATADAFELAGTTPLATVVSARAYDVSAAPPEDSPTPVSEVPAVLLDDDRVADVGRFELPAVEESSHAAADLVDLLLAAPTEVSSTEPAEPAFALTSPQVAETSERDDVDDIAAQEAARDHRRLRRGARGGRPRLG